MNAKELRATVEEQVRQRYLQEHPLPAIGKPLRNTKHELFCMYVLEGKFLKDAYKKAGYHGNERSIRSNASALHRRPDVAARIAGILEHRAAVLIAAM